jgi:hypothetical protein
MSRRPGDPKIGDAIGQISPSALFSLLHPAGAEKERLRIPQRRLNERRDLVRLVLAVRIEGDDCSSSLNQRLLKSAPEAVSLTPVLSVSQDQDVKTGEAFTRLIG